MGTPPPTPYPPIEEHGVIGDRRTAALVAADGTVDWLCLPNFDGEPVFASLLDAERGGFWRFGPAFTAAGRQRWVPETATLITEWESADGLLELRDAMLWPQTERPAPLTERRAVLRRLRCRHGKADCAFEIRPRDNFDQGAAVQPIPGGIRFDCGSRSLALWASFPLSLGEGAAMAGFRLARGEEAWAVLDFDKSGPEWTVAAARSALEESDAYWQRWTAALSYLGPRREQVKRSALMFQLMSFAPSGALVASPSAGLPERIGGKFNVDYRYTWIRDISLSIAILAMLGDLETSERYMDWVSKLDSSTEMPLQVLYRIDGGTKVKQKSRSDIAGYRESRPVIFGNSAYKQKQIDSLGYFADCAHIYLQQKGKWKPEYWAVIRRLADYTVGHWREPGNGIWELDSHEHFVSSKVMSWVTLDRALKIAVSTGAAGDLDSWRRSMEEIHSEVMRDGWSEELQAFRQRYGAEALDASALLIPIMGFLQPDHPRVKATLQRIEQRLMSDGLVYRFDPKELPNPTETPLGEREAAFLPCCFWLAAAYAMSGGDEKAEAILDRAERIAGGLGIYAEGLDPRDDTYRGNTPLLFSHAEHVRAVLELGKARPMGMLGIAAGQALHHARRWISGT